MLSGLVQREGHGVFDGHGSSDAWVPAIDRLIGELISEGVTVDALRGASGAPRDGRCVRSTRRDQAAVTIYEAWHTALLPTLVAATAAIGWCVLRRTSARSRTRSLGRSAHGARCVWLASPICAVAGPHYLRALVTSPALDAVTVFASHELALPDHVRVQYDRDPGSVAAPIALLEAPDVARGTELVAVRVRGLLDAGAPPSRIGVFYRGARPGVDAMASGASQPSGGRSPRVDAPRSQRPVPRVPSARAPPNAAASGWTRQSVMEIAEQPLLASGLAPDVLESAASWQVITSLDEWTDALANLLTRCEARDERARQANASAFRRATLPPTTRVQEAHARWITLIPVLRQLEATRAVNDWFSWVAEVLQGDAWGLPASIAIEPGGDHNAWRVDVRARARCW